MSGLIPLILQAIGVGASRQFRSSLFCSSRVTSGMSGGGAGNVNIMLYLGQSILSALCVHLKTVFVGVILSMENISELPTVIL